MAGDWTWLFWISPTTSAGLGSSVALAEALDREGVALRALVALPAGIELPREFHARRGFREIQVLRLPRIVSAMDPESASRLVRHALPGNVILEGEMAARAYGEPGALARVVLRDRGTLRESDAEELARSHLVTMADTERLRKLKLLRPDFRGLVVPELFRDQRRRPTPPPHAGLRLLWEGDLGVPADREGLEWFLDEVWPQALRERRDLSLRLLSVGDSKILLRRLPMKNVDLCDKTEVLDEALLRADLLIAPTFLGARAKERCLTAALSGRASLGPALIPEALGLVQGESFLEAETTEEWREILVRLQSVDGAALGDRAAERLLSLRSADDAARTFADALRGLSSAAGCVSDARSR